VANLVAVTFTRKAASEMRTRLKARFQELYLTSTGERKERWSGCLAEIDGARIGTIHSLCESILKAFPVEAGIDPQFEVLDDLARAEMFDEAIEQAFREAMQTQSPAHEFLVEYDIAKIRQWLSKILIAALELKEALSAASPSDGDAFKAQMNAVMLN